jgi:hypothetical protein
MLVKITWCPKLKVRREEKRREEERELLQQVMTKAKLNEQAERNIEEGSCTGQDILFFYGTSRFITTFINTCYWALVFNSVHHPGHR